MRKTSLSLLFGFVIATTACGGNDDGGDGDGDGDGDGADAAVEALSCGSLALCTSHEVKRFIAQPGTPQGGTIADGTYVFAWQSELRANPDDRSEGYFSSVQSIVFSGGTWLGAGFGFEERGTYRTDGNNLTLTATNNCFLGSEDGDGEREISWPYTAQGNELRLFSAITSGNEEWVRENVYLRSDATSICNVVENEPTAPGPSAQCQVSNCYCNVAQGQTIDRDSCE